MLEKPGCKGTVRALSQRQPRARGRNSWRPSQARRMAPALHPEARGGPDSHGLLGRLRLPPAQRPAHGDALPGPLGQRAPARAARGGIRRPCGPQHAHLWVEPAEGALTGSRRPGPGGVPPVPRGLRGPDLRLQHCRLRAEARPLTNSYRLSNHRGSPTGRTSPSSRRHRSLRARTAR